MLTLLAVGIGTLYIVWRQTGHAKAAVLVIGLLVLSGCGQGVPVAQEKQQPTQSHQNSANQSQLPPLPEEVPEDDRQADKPAATHNQDAADYYAKWGFWLS